jgi:glycosyltransferase involved in cell wall biosynthesis
MMRPTIPGSRRPIGLQITPSRMAFVTSTPLNVTGGSGTYVGITQLARALREKNIQVEMQFPTRWSPNYTLRRIVFNLLVASSLRRVPYDWVVGFDLDGFHYGRTKTAPYIASIKGVIADELTNERGVTRAVLRIQAAFERLAVHRADVVVATSQYSRSRIVEAYGIPAQKIVIVPELIDLRSWGERVEQTTGVQTNPPAVLTVAHMYARKNLGLLMEAYARLRDMGIPFRGWVVGEGPCRAAWERLRDTHHLGGRVMFLGTIPRRDLMACYQRAAIFCLPSRQEGFGIVFLEAMACGKPVVAARTSAVPETVIDSETGLLIDPDDAEALARALAVLLSDPERCRAMGEAGRRRVEQYRADRVAESFLLRVHAVLNDRPESNDWADLKPQASLANRGSHRIGVGGGR